MERISVQFVSLRKLRLEIKKCKFAIPELQREFVWNPKKICELLDSIFHNYPIGSLLIWKADRSQESLLRTQNHILPEFNRKNNRHIHFLIDGQQRLSVLWHVLSSEGKTVSNEARVQIDFAKIYFDPLAEESEKRFLYRDNISRDQREHLVRITDLLSPRWSHYSKQFPNRARRQASQCRAKLLDYKLPLIECETNEIDEVRTCFIRINSLGMRIDVADRAFARAAKFDLRATVRDIREKLKNGFSDVDKKTILQIFARASGIDDLGERATDNFSKRLENDESEVARMRRRLPNLKEAIKSAADYFVSDLGVPHYKLLPSKPMFMVLAMYFLENGAKRPKPSAQQSLAQWFWATAVGSRYTGRGYRRNLNADIEFMRKLAEESTTKPNFKMKLRIQILRDADYSRPGPLTNAFQCVLRRRQPRYLEDGEKIPLGETSSLSNGSDKHHIFPRALLMKNGVPVDRCNSILNICLLVAKDNRSIGKRPPHRYFAIVPPDSRKRNVIFDSHLIPAKDDAGIWDSNIKNGFRDFLRDRELLIANEFQRLAGTKLFDHSKNY